MKRSISLAVGALALLAVPFAVWADTASTSVPVTPTLDQQIAQQNAAISQLDTEIGQYQSALNQTTQQKNTLQNQLNQINLSVKKTNASISATQHQITSTTLQIQELGTQINGAQQSIATDTQAVGEMIRTLNGAESEPVIVQIISSDNLAGAWQDIDDILSIQSAVSSAIQNLTQQEHTLSQAKSQTQTKQQQLQTQQQTLKTQQGSLTATQESQSQLLAQTKSQESTYESIIAQKKAQESSFEQSLDDLKAQYNEAVNPNQITAAGAGVLQWPIYGTVRITQYFGNTPYSDAHEALYSGHGHDGLDIGAPIGTPVHAALSGTILATGNTDSVKSCVGGSFGKWVMIKHDNGLNTMYAHLSAIDVTQGQTVSTGDVIGYSGETGYATGPHLHFGVYVSSVTQIIPLGQATGGNGACSKAVMPVPPVSGYLNPLNYLPATSFVDDTQ